MRIHPGQTEPTLRQPVADDLEEAFDELANLVPDSVPAPSPESLRRENLHSREDEFLPYEASPKRQ
jgi:hypothetical protein